MFLSVAGFISGKVATSGFSWKIQFKQRRKPFFRDPDPRNTVGGPRGLKAESWWGIGDKVTEIDIENTKHLWKY